MKRAPLGDLFRLFPDLPWPRRRSIESQRARMARLVAAAKVRAVDNARRQHEISRRFRAMVEARRRRGSAV